jgi:hypothetical protein
MVLRLHQVEGGQGLRKAAATVRQEFLDLDLGRRRCPCDHGEPGMGRIVEGEMRWVGKEEHPVEEGQLS